MNPIHPSRRAVLIGGAAGAALLGAPAHAAQQLRLAHVAPANSSYQRAAEAFGRHLEELTEGEITLQTLPGGTLGDLKQLWAQLQIGAIDFHLIDPAALVALDQAASFRVISAPFLFDDMAHFHRYLESDLFAEQMAEVDEAVGIAWIGYLGDRSPRGVSTTSRPIRSQEDMEGLRLRVFENPIAIAGFEAWGANPIAIPAPEIYNAIETGMVEGQDNGLIDTVNMGFAGVQPYYSELNTMFSGIGLWMNGAKWASLSPEIQAAVREAAALARDDMDAAFASDDAAARAALKEAGVEVVVPDRASFREAADALAAGMDGTAWPAGLYERIRGL